MRSTVLGSLLAGLALPRGLLAAPQPAESHGFTAAPSDGLKSLVARQTPMTSATDFANFKYFVQLAAASYCNNKASLVGTKVTCSSNACPSVGANNVVNYAHLDTDINAQMDGAVYIDHTSKNIVFSYMGSKSVTSYLIDLDFSVADVSELCSGCRISYGYRTVWTQSRNSLVTAIQKAMAQYPGYGVVGTGHSAGAGVSSIATSYLRKQYNIPVTLYTFGSPRVGNAKWATFVTNQAPSMGMNYRVTHYNDPITAVPPTWIDDMAHISPEYWLQRKDASTMDYPISEVLVCTGVQPSGCRASTGTTLNTEAHSYYFEKVSACYSS